MAGNYLCQTVFTKAINIIGTVRGGKYEKLLDWKNTIFDFPWKVSESII